MSLSRPTPGLLPQVQEASPSAGLGCCVTWGGGAGRGRSFPQLPPPPVPGCGGQGNYREEVVPPADCLGWKVPGKGLGVGDEVTAQGKCPGLWVLLLGTVAPGPQQSLRLNVPVTIAEQTGIRRWEPARLPLPSLHLAPECQTDLWVPPVFGTPLRKKDVASWPEMCHWSVEPQSSAEV